MGNWHISIKGVGQHHNESKRDAEQMAAKFVEELKKAGHSISSADVHYGGAVDTLSKLGMLKVKDE